MTSAFLMLTSSAGFFVFYLLNFLIANSTTNIIAKVMGKLRRAALDSHM